MNAVADEVEAEAERLFRALVSVDCEPGVRWDYEACRRVAPLTIEINSSSIAVCASESLEAIAGCTPARNPSP